MAVDRAAHRRELYAAIEATKTHLRHLQAELDRVEQNYVQVKFLEGFNEFTTPSDNLYTYRDPSGTLCVGDLVQAGFKNALARVVKLGRNNIVDPRDIKDIGFRLRSEKI